MADIKLHRDHSLGLARARTVARKWADHVKNKFDMECSLVEGDAMDTLSFTRSGVHGTMTLTANAFDLHAKLGMLLGPFAGQIEAEVSRQLDSALAKETARAA